MINELSAVVGEKEVSMQKIDRLAYSSDASQIHGKTKVVVWPKNKQHVQKIIKYARKTHSNIVPRGAGTGLAGAAVPNNSIVLDFSKMNNILRVNTEKKYVIVEPGVVLSDLQKYLERANLFFPVVPASHKVCTIGGMISTNAVGERAIKYGETKQWVIGLEVIDGKGNLHELKKGKDIESFCGTEGTLGVITKAKLLVREPIKNRSMTLLKFDKICDLINTVRRYLVIDEVIAIEFFDKLSAKLSGLGEKYYLFVEFESKKGEIKPNKEIEKIWGLREGIGPVLSSAGYSHMEDPRIPFEKLEQFLKWLEKNKIPHFGHIGLGIIHPRFRNTQRKLINGMFMLVEKLEGRVSGEHGIGLTKKRFADRGFTRRIRVLKAKYDPESILNIGKVI